FQCNCLALSFQQYAQGIRTVIPQETRNKGTCSPRGARSPRPLGGLSGQHLARVGPEGAPCMF
ncbi:hypothetical protein NDU88_001542, partial [Pleurodeles waltl]